ncbi:MAG: cytochrome c [Sphingomonadales bacterium]
MRLLLTVAIAAVALTTLPAAAADPIKAREEIMEGNGKAAKAGGAMLKGEAPFDAAKAQGILASFATGAKEFGKHFPKGSDKGDTEAAPAIWEKPADWKAALAKFETDSAAAAAMKPAALADFGKAFGMVTANCKSCHEAFRIKKN